MSAARGLYILILTGLWSFSLAAQNVYGQTLLPIADSFVASDSPTTNYGTAAYLLVQGNNATVSDNKQFVYLKFDITSLSANVSTAKVRLYPPNTLLEPRVLAAYSVADNSWTETGITWNNRPSHSVCAIGEIYPSVDQQATWQEIDITEYVRNEVIAGHSTLSLAFHMSDDEGAAPTALNSFNSREASSNGPQLVVTTGSYTSPVAVGSPFVATADAGVRSGSPTTNFNQKLNQVFQSGTAPEYVWNYIKFDTSTFIPTVDSAKLRMFGARRSNAASPPSDATLLFYSVADTTWAETGITWTNKPAIGASPLSTITISDNAMQWREWDVSSYVQAEKAAGRHVVSFAIKNNVTASNISKFHAREASCKLPALYLKAPVALYFIHPDHLNTPRLVADATGTTVWRWDQAEPFGVNVPDENPSGLGAFDLPLRLPGQYYDKETGLHQNINRDYDPSIGIFKQSDPIGLGGGLNTYSYADSVGELTSPGLNPYLYARANPLSYSDPLGLHWEYSISSRQLWYFPPNGRTPDFVSAAGYSGRAEGLNNPLWQLQPASEPRNPQNPAGPLPEGAYRIGQMRNSPNTGPNVMDLTPLPGTNPFGRSAFQIHGDNSCKCDSASTGCIVLPLDVRRRINRSSDRVLKVTP